MAGTKQVKNPKTKAKIKKDRALLPAKKSCTYQFF